MTKIRRFPELDQLAAICVSDFAAAPCAVVACAYRNAEGWCVDEGAYGHLAPGEAPADPSTLFDLASLTKPFSALTFARLVRAELLEWEMPIGVPLRDVHGTPSASVPLAWFVAHRSGLEGHRPLYAPLERGATFDRFQALRRAGQARRPECDLPPDAEGFPAVYSDLGYLLLGEAMARSAGVPLDELVRREVLEPLSLSIGSARQCRRIDPAFDSRVAPTENVAWRGGLIRGAVHDENAWALGKDASCAHAGLFGTARDVATLGTAILDAARGEHMDWLAPQDLEPLLRKRPGTTWRAGFDSKSSNGSSAGKTCSAETFGHLGFTGTSIWIDPTIDVVVVLLSNRVCPSRDCDAIKAVRPAVNDALFAWGARRRTP
jgi:CubicO group peptidase (beta-lactamase class C family)